MVVRQHGPKAAQSRRRDADPELRQVSLQKCPHKIPPPVLTGRLRARQKGGGKAAAQPEAIARFQAHFVQSKPAQLIIVDPAGQRLRGLLEEGRRGTPEYQEASRPLGPISEHPEDWK